jgi:endonuclease/exonuclease/phosphatase (EEP) superfamily protein YafD
MAFIAKRGAIAGGVLLVVSIAGFFGDVWWIFDLLAPFRVQYSVVAVLLSTAAMMRPSRRALLPAASLTVNLACIVPALAPAAGHEDDHPLVVLHFNVHTATEDKAPIVEYLRGAGADVLFLLEVDQAWMRAIEGLGEPYHVVVARPASDNFGIALVSRIPIESHRVLILSQAMVPSIEAVVRWRGRSTVLLGTHPIPPVCDGCSKTRDEQLSGIAAWSAAEKRPRSVHGDLNVTRWSPVFWRVLEDGGLTAQPSLTPTWPYSGSPLLAPLRIPIDFALTSSSVGVVAYEVGPSNGSDHRPVRVSLGLR